MASPLVDLYGASVIMEIADKNGNFKPISQIIGSISPNVTFVESISVKITILRLFELHVVLTPPFAEGVKLIESGLLGVGLHADRSTGAQTLGPNGQATASKTKINLNQMRVQVFYGGKSSRAFKAFLLPPEIDLSLEGIKITLNGIGLLWNATKTNSRKTYSGVSRESIIRDFLSTQSNVVVQVSPKASAALSVPEHINQNKQDFEMVQDLLEKSNCVGTEIGANQLNDTQVYDIKHKSEIRSTQAAYKFVAFQQINPNAGIFPLFDIDTVTTNLELPGGAFGKKAYTWDKDNKVDDGGVDVGVKTYVTSDGKPKSSGVTNQVSSGDSSMAGANVDANGNPVSGGPPIGVPNKDGATNLLDRVKGVVHDYMDKVFEYELSTVGVVDLLPGQVVDVAVANIGFLTGSYDLWEVRHSISVGGIETSMTCYRTGGLSSLISNNVEKVKTKFIPSQGQRAVKKSQEIG